MSAEYNAGPEIVTANVVGGTTRYQAGDGSLTTGSGDAITQPHQQTQQRTSSATSVTPSGGPVIDLSRPRDASHSLIRASEMTDESLVTIDGMTVQIGTLELQGFVRKTADGRYEVAPKVATEATGEGNNESNTTERTDDGVKAEPLAPEVERNLAEAFTQAPGEALAIADAILRDADPSASVGHLASRLGIEPAEAQARVDAAMEAYQSEAFKMAGRQIGSENVADAFGWLQENRPSQLKDAMRSHFDTGRPDYQALLVDYVANGLDPETIMATSVPGYTFSQGPDGQVLVKLANGMQTTWATAVTAGLMPVGRRR